MVRNMIESLKEGIQCFCKEPYAIIFMLSQIHFCIMTYWYQTIFTSLDARLWFIYIQQAQCLLTSKLQVHTLLISSVSLVCLYCIFHFGYLFLSQHSYIIHDLEFLSFLMMSKAI